MSTKYASYVIPSLGIFCVAGAVAVVISARAPLQDIDAGEAVAYDSRVPENFKPDENIPSMERVLEKHLFVKERKATGQNTFPDLVVKGVYVGTECNAVFSLKYRPTANVRVWQGDVDSVIGQITNERDPRKPIVNFLNEWDIKEITFKGVVFEHIITGEVETYLVDYTPSKHVTDNAEAGYGQGMLAVSSTGTKTVKKTTTKTTSSAQLSNEQRAAAFSNMRNMVREMSSEQREQLAERIKGGGGSSRGGNQSSGNSSSSSSSSRGSSTSSSGRSSRSR